MSDDISLVETLIAKASESAGSDYKLAKLLHVSRFAVSAWKHGKKPCPVADQALMASIAGLDASQWAARALIAQHEGTAKGDALYKALGKALLATGGAAASFGASAHQTYSLIETTVSNFIRCILC